MKHLLISILVVLCTLPLAFADENSPEANLEMLGTRLVAGEYEGTDLAGIDCAVEIEVSEDLDEVTITITNDRWSDAEAVFETDEDSEPQLVSNTDSFFYMFNRYGEPGFISIERGEETDTFYSGLHLGETLNCQIEGAFSW